MDISAINTVNLIAQAKGRALELGLEVVPKIMTDGGPENDNHRVLTFLTSKGLRRMIARVDVHFSNSMVESLFRLLKSYFLKDQYLRSVSDVERKVDFFFTEHNEVIPKIQIRGATPKEMYLNQWTDTDIARLKSGLAAAAEKRRADFNSLSCVRCSDPVPAEAKLG